ncbi:histidine phosphatase family protein [Paenibacillus sp. FSL K6-2862]|uniref:histidine phosphatase family protein n=1 Tax=Paenibacillus sp. FSL K6-2862 TaxID=2921484 RepID=UPI0030F8A8E4
MDITFIRHGHGEHLIDYPNRLNELHPGLTELGKSQVTTLCKQLKLDPHDVILVSPTRRTIETALLLTAEEHLTIVLLLVQECFLRIRSSFPSSVIRSIPRRSLILSSPG